MIRRKKLTLFIEAKESMTVFELKRMIEGITRKVPNEQRLFTSENVLMEDDKLLSEFGISPANAKAENPFEIGLAMSADGSFEELEKTPYSSPPELPDVMKPGQDSGVATHEILSA